jgi:lipopolysaccharide export system protein LptA
LLAAAAALFLMTALPAASAPGKKPAPQAIEIRSDRLLVDSQKRTAEFFGRVRARQGDTTIEADQLTVYYHPDGGENVDALDRIVAVGNVRIRFENRLAETPEAVYNVKERVFVLNGAGTRVSSGSSHITGEKITLYRDDGRVVVESGSQKQVEAVFYPGDEQAAPAPGKTP